MTSFISALSLLILVLANGYFAVPLFDEYTSTSFSSINDDLTTEHAVNFRFVSDGETTESPIEMTTSMYSSSEESASRQPRLFDESFTTEEPSVKQPDYKDLSFTTPESFTEVVEHHARGVEGEDETETEGENKDRRDMPTESSTVFQSSSTSTSTVVTPKFHTEESTTTLSSPLQIELLESSTKKYIGLLKDDNEQDENTGNKFPAKPLKSLRKPIKPLKKPTEDQSSEESKIQPKDSSEEVVTARLPKKNKYEQEDDTKDSSIPIAMFDQESLKNIPTVANGFMVLDESNDPIVTITPDKLSKINTENKKEQKQLNQGEKSSYSEEKKSNN